MANTGKGVVDEEPASIQEQEDDAPKISKTDFQEALAKQSKKTLGPMKKTLGKKTLKVVAPPKEEVKLPTEPPA